MYVQSRRGDARVPRSKRQESGKADFIKVAQECEYADLVFWWLI